MRTTLAMVIAGIAGLLPGEVLAAPPPLVVQVNRAIDKGVEAVRSWQKEDGRFDTHDQRAYPVGNTALHLYALLKSGVPAGDRQVLSALEYLRFQKVRKTYSAATLIMALDALPKDSETRWIGETARWLEERFNAEGGLWAYPGHHHDLSNTQYGVLGLWVAERHGFRAKTETWAKLLDSFLDSHQRDDGGFAYRHDRTQTGSMTTAGITILALAVERVPEDSLKHRKARRKAVKALERAWAWLDRRWSPKANLLGTHAFTRKNHYYYLFGVERVAAICKRERIGGWNWYADGARWLVGKQDDKGVWGNARQTSFALLFLRRATFTGLDGKPETLDEDGVEKPRPIPKSPGSDVPFIRRWLILGPFDNADDEGLYRPVVNEATVAPRNRDRVGKQEWRVVWNLTDWVDLRWAVSAGDHQWSYAFTWLRVDKEVDAALYLGHDDDCRVWLDGELVHDYHFREARGRDSVRMHVKLTAGMHRLLVKVCNGRGAHGFSVRFAMPDGKPVTGFRPSLERDGNDLTATALAQPGFFPLHALREVLPVDLRTVWDFRKEDSLRRLALASFFPREVLWFDLPRPKKKMGPSPGAEGVLRLHAGGRSTPARVLWRVGLAKSARRLQVRVSADPYRKHRGRVADAVLRLSVFDGKLHRIAEQVVGPHATAVPENWVTVEGDLRPFAGREVLLVLECANGGRTGWWVEDLYLDEIAVLSH